MANVTFRDGLENSPPVSMHIETGVPTSLRIPCGGFFDRTKLRIALASAPFLILPLRDTVDSRIGRMVFTALIFGAFIGLKGIYESRRADPSQVRTVTQRGLIVADEEGIRFERGSRVVWELPWHRILGYTPDSRLNHTVLHGIDGIDRIVPFVLSPAAPFEAKINALRRMLSANGIEPGYARTQSTNLSKTPTDLKLAGVMSIAGLVILSVGVLAVSYLERGNVEIGMDYVLWTKLNGLAPLLQVFGVAIFVGSGSVAFVLARDRRRALWNAGKLQLGCENSLYRQLTSTDPIAYGRYRYPGEIDDLPSTEQTAFKLNWSRPDALLTGIDRELFWTPEGIRLRSEGPVCEHLVIDLMKKSSLSGLVALVVYEKGKRNFRSIVRMRLGTFAPPLGDVFDPRYLIRVDE